ncbi:D-glycero-alpha-D-manno-heptose-1,7-bisphosphate 7-phosphatase [Streptantibioticus rubrisoli]|uniref:D-glycero-alpha-D-manno-heptose-1,7-bisphosphate 7-phosphatase n=1 Tax=Streptantibioticus rubrisoli TaxID=1387313 RepID=UPI0027E2B4CD|nr:HAD-IIIA family hydrolase [Streptantibioticus rubrisoli]
MAPGCGPAAAERAAPACPDTDAPLVLAHRSASSTRRAVSAALPTAVLFDRDGTLIEDVPYNGAPERVRPVPGARRALSALRRHGILLGVVSNQSGIARGLLTRADVDAVRRRVEELLGPFDIWVVCPHGPYDGCRCRKPAPGLIHTAVARLGVERQRTAVIGDIGADVDAARAAGARGILVPNEQTDPREVAAAAETAPTLLTAVLALLGGEPEASR